MKFYDIGEGPLMGLSEKHIAPLVLGGIIELPAAPLLNVCASPNGIGSGASMSCKAKSCRSKP